MPAPTPMAVIEAYVTDVVRRLPRRLRNDVGYELRALLGEELRGRAGDEGRLADAAMALELVNRFGRPEDVAERYHPPGMTIIPPSQTVGFAWTALIGVALQWAGTLPLIWSEPSGLGRWWVSYGLGALWWPGFLVMVALAAALVRRLWPAGKSAWRPKPDAVRDPDEVNRLGFGLGLAAALAGVALWIGVAWMQATASFSFAEAFRFDPNFLATRGLALLLFWAAGITLMVVVLVEGRWRRLTRRLDLGVKLLSVALMVWLIAGGPIFVHAQTDAGMRNGVILVLAIVIVSLAAGAWLKRRRLRPPA